jgi:DnaJ-class molecular chaperone
VRCYLKLSAAEDPQRLLEAGLQLTPPWRGSEDGERCDKCRGRGRVGFECWSCLLTGANHACPVCHGRARWEGKCPVCRGTGKTDAQPRQGVRAFPTVEALYHHLLANDAAAVGMLVEIEAEPAEDVDFYADQGSLLVTPTAIERTRPMEPDSLHTIRSLTER